jgi:hypothetical protein
MRYYADGGPEGSMAGRATLRLDTRTPNAARIYDLLLGGKDNYAADRAAAERIARHVPHCAAAARQNRRFLGRTVRLLAESGIRQFLDIGSGLPTRSNVHEIAQAVLPESRVVYVDYDSVAVSHAKARPDGRPAPRRRPGGLPRHRRGNRPGQEPRCAAGLPARVGTRHTPGTPGDHAVLRRARAGGTGRDGHRPVAGGGSRGKDSAELLRRSRRQSMTGVPRGLSEPSPGKPPRGPAREGRPTAPGWFPRPAGGCCQSLFPDEARKEGGTTMLILPTADGAGADLVPVARGPVPAA